VVELDLSTVVSCMSGPKRPHDRVPVTEMKTDFQQCLTGKVNEMKEKVSDKLNLEYFKQLESTLKTSAVN